MPKYPTPTRLYKYRDLEKGFDPTKAASYCETFDFQLFRRFMADGEQVPKALSIRRKQVDHDARIADHLRRFLLKPARRIVGIMGGHKVQRSEEAYRALARLTRTLTRDGFTIVSGGGPGAMEAAHLGAAFSTSSDPALEEALTSLSGHPKLPSLRGLVLPDGSIAKNREKDIEDAHRWMLAALDALSKRTADVGESIAIPTWLYGQEPTIPFASHYAKYFQNSIREEALVTEARAGIVYARGGGGTLREVFQDLEQNYYALSSSEFTPMIFFDPDDYWTKEAEYDDQGALKKARIKIDQTLKQILSVARAPTSDAPQCLAKVAFTTSETQIKAIFETHAPIASRNLKKLAEGKGSELRAKLHAR